MYQVRESADPATLVGRGKLTRFAQKPLRTKRR